jgi:hypothetical protein
MVSGPGRQEVGGGGGIKPPNYIISLYILSIQGIVYNSGILQGILIIWGPRDPAVGLCCLYKEGEILFSEDLSL